MPPWKVNYVEEIEDDFSSEEQLMKIKEKMDFVCLNPNSYSKRIKNAPALFNK